MEELNGGVGPAGRPRWFRGSRDLLEQASAFAAAARSPRTRREYTRAWQAFVAWCQDHGQPPLPAYPDAVALYLTARATAGKRVATVEQDLSAITAAHRLAGFPSPREAAVVRAVGRGIRQGLASSAARARKTERDIMRQTRHKSAQMVRRYIREAGVFEDNGAYAARGISRGMPRARLCRVGAETRSVVRDLDRAAMVDAA